MRTSTVAFLVGLVLPAVGYLYLRCWLRALLAYVLIFSCAALLWGTEHLQQPQGVALLALTLGMVYVYALIDGWQIGRRVDAQQLSAQLATQRLEGKSSERSPSAQGTDLNRP